MILKKIFEFSYEFAFVAIFISIFFFTLGKDIEHNSVDKQLNNLVDDFYDTVTTIPITTFLSEKKSIIKNIMKQNKSPSDENNKTLKRNLLIIIGTLLLTIIVLYYVFGRKYGIKISTLLLENIILFTFVGSFEYYFFSNYVTKYVPLLPSEVNGIVKKKLIEKTGLDTDNINVKTTFNLLTELIKNKLGVGGLSGIQT